MSQKLIALEPATHKRLTIRARQRGKTIKAFASAIIDAYFRRLARKPQK